MEDSFNGVSVMFFSRNQQSKAKARAKGTVSQLMRVLLIEEAIRTNEYEDDHRKAELLEEAYNIRRTLIRYYARYRRIAKGYRPFDTALSPEELV